MKWILTATFTVYNPTSNFVDKITFSTKEACQKAADKIIKENKRYVDKVTTTCKEKK